MPTPSRWLRKLDSLPNNPAQQAGEVQYFAEIPWASRANAPRPGKPGPGSIALRDGLAQGLTATREYDMLEGMVRRSIWR